MPIADGDVASQAAGGAALSRVTWIGHSTVLIELDGTRVVTDPVLRDRVGVLRRVAPSAGPDAPNVDAVLISHVHYDHLDLPSLRRFAPKTLLLVPQGARRHLRTLRFSDVREIACGDSVSVGRLTIRSTFADHDARRHPLGRVASSLGYLVTGAAHIYFAGDTDLFDGMTGIDPDLDVALLPIAGWGPRVPAGHLDPVRAAEAVRRLRPRLAIPIHWGTYRRFDLSVDAGSLREPADMFAQEARRVAPEATVRVLSPGETTDVQPRRLSETAQP